MAITLTWSEIVFRLLCAFAAGTLIGANREEHARPAGLRTTVLVCLAACIAMLQANQLLHTIGKTPDSFVVLDLMRLPLGILSGMGFIGAGAILRRDNLVIGVTTAATLWFVTVMGLCFGGGQYGLGAWALALGLVVLWGMKKAEHHWKQACRGKLKVTVARDGPDESAIAKYFAGENFKIRMWSVMYGNSEHENEYECLVEWRGRAKDSAPPELLKKLANTAGVKKIHWEPQEAQ